MVANRVIAIGGSAGGVGAVRIVLGGLSADVRAAVCVVLHLAPDQPSHMPEALGSMSQLPVTFAQDGESIELGRVYVAPPDHHLMLERGVIRLNRGPRECLHRPAANPLFRSAAHVFGTGAIGVVLSGLLDDGAAGLWAVKKYGGIAVVQDPEDAAWGDMPREALRAVKADYVLPASEIGPKLTELALVPHLN